MSTQLILYPQNTIGYSFNTNLFIQEYVSNHNFTSPFSGTIQNAVYGVNSNFRYNDFMATAPPIGNWQGFHSNSGNGWHNNTPAPTISNGILTLSGTTGTSSKGSICGVYQSVFGLTVGQSYDLVIQHSGTLLNKGYYYIAGYGTHTFNQKDFIGQVPNTPTGSSPTQISNTGNSTLFTFTATNSTMTLLIAYLSDFNNGTLDISEISIKETGAVPTLVFQDLSDGSVICDLYKEEDIPLSLSVDDFTNVAEKTQSYSKDFDLPATKRNNKIFTHIFEITKNINDAFDFNPYKQTKAILKQNGVLIFEGSLRLIEIVEKDNEISYNVNLYSETVALADILKTKTFSNLTNVFTELDHQYTLSNIQASFVGALALDFPLGAGSFAGASGATTTDVLKYPFVDWTGNIDCTGSEPVIEHKSDVFRPFIKLQYIIRNIISEAGYDYISAFIDSSFFGSLYMDFNWGNGNAPTNVTSNSSAGAGGFPEDLNAPVSNFAQLSYTAVEAYDFPLLGNMPAMYDQTTHQYTSTLNNNFVTYQFVFIFQNTDTTSAHNLEVQVLAAGSQVAYSGVISIPAPVGGISGLFAYSGQVQVTLQNTEVLETQFRCTTGNNKIKQYESFAPTGQNTYVQYFSTATAGVLTSGILLNTLRGDTGQWDFFKSVMTMFNLVTIADPDNPNVITIEPYNDIFGFNPTAVTPKQLDWTYKLDKKDINLKPLELVRKTIFKYAEDSDDFAFNKYKNAASGFLYGSRTFIQSTYTLLSGEDEIVAESFAATIIKPIQDNFPDFYAPVIYSGNNEGEFEGFENMPRILIDCGVRTEDYEVEGTNLTDYLLMSHTDQVTSGYGDTDINFGICQLFIGLSPVDNLFSTYYADYYEHLYNPNTRILTAKLNLTPADINTFKFYDIVTLKNRQFRVNKIDYVPNGLSKVEFILLN